MQTTPAAGYRADENDSAMRVLGQFRQVFNAVRSHFHKLEEQVGIGGAQVWALSVIRDAPGIGINELAAHLNVRQPTASNLVKSLANRGMVETSRSRADKRNVQISITPAGLLAVSRAPGPANGVLPHALAHLPTDVLAQLEGNLSLLVAQLKVDEQAARIPLSELVGNTSNL